MIDENKEQLRNLFRNYNILDVQPAVSGKAPDDLTTLQVCVPVQCMHDHLKSVIHFVSGCLFTCSLSFYIQMAIIILAVLLFLAAMLFIFTNWYYRTV